MIVLNVELFDSDGPDTHKMAIGPFDHVETAERYFRICRFEDYEDYFGYEIIVVNLPDGTMLVKASLDPELN